MIVMEHTASMTGMVTAFTKSTRKIEIVLFFYRLVIMSNQSGVVYICCLGFMLVMLTLCGGLTALFLGLAYGAYRHGSSHEGLEITAWICLGLFGVIFSVTVYLVHHWRCCPQWCYADV